MIARAIAAKVPFWFFAAGSVYGTGEVETLLREAGKGYVPGVSSNHVFRSWGKQQPVAGTASASRRASQEGLAPPVVQRRDQRSALARLGYCQTASSRDPPGPDLMLAMIAGHCHQLI